MAKQKANARITAQTTINDELVSKAKEVYIPDTLEAAVEEYGEAGCVDMIVNQKVLNIQSDIRRAIKDENSTAKGGGKVRKGIERF